MGGLVAKVHFKGAFVNMPRSIPHLFSIIQAQMWLLRTSMLNSNNTFKLKVKNNRYSHFRTMKVKSYEKAFSNFLLHWRNEQKEYQIFIEFQKIFKKYIWVWAKGLKYLWNKQRGLSLMWCIMGIDYWVFKTDLILKHFLFFNPFVYFYHCV